MRGKIVLHDKKQKPLIMSGTLSDISERKTAQEELELASLVYHASSEAMAVTDANGTILSVNPAFTQTTGYTLDEVLGKNVSLLKSGHHGQRFYEVMWRALNTTGQWQGEIWNKRKNGELFPEWLNISSTFSPDGTVQRRIALFSDITKRKQLQELLWQQANIDLLTGLPNRRMLFERLQQEINKADRHQHIMALLFLDLDTFKDVNDSLGHDKGDVLLQEVAERLTASVRKIDTVARLGGDEFTVLLSDLHAVENIELIVQKILDAIAQPFTIGDEVIYISTSIGITFYPHDASTPENLLKNADQAMYAAKNRGKNTYHYFTPSMQEAALVKSKLIKELRNALSLNQIDVYYQPIINLKTERIEKAEALVRWQHPEFGMVNPGEFISVAEEIGLIVDISDYVFRRAAKQSEQLRSWYDPQFQISVNISPVQFRHTPSCFLSWFEYLKSLPSAGNGIVIEITESLLMDSQANTLEQLARFREVGCPIALDDFGTGYSSLAYIKNFNLDFLKIDKAFVQGLCADSRDMALCEAIINIAHKLNMQVVAEGVETRLHQDLLSGAGCDYVQGYLYSRPMPEKDLLTLLKEKPSPH